MKEIAAKANNIWKSKRLVYGAVEPKDTEVQAWIQDHMINDPAMLCLTIDILSRPRNLEQSNKLVLDLFAESLLGALIYLSSPPQRRRQRHHRRLCGEASHSREPSGKRASAAGQAHTGDANRLSRAATALAAGPRQLGRHHARRRVRGQGLRQRGAAVARRLGVSATAICTASG